MARARRQLAAPRHRLHECPSCRKPTPHEMRVRRRGVEAWVCSVCGLVSLVTERARPGPVGRP